MHIHVYVKTGISPKKMQTLCSLHERHTSLMCRGSKTALSGQKIRISLKFFQRINHILLFKWLKFPLSLFCTNILLQCVIKKCLDRKASGRLDRYVHPSGSWRVIEAHMATECFNDLMSGTWHRFRLIKKILTGKKKKAPPPLVPVWACTACCVSRAKHREIWQRLI